MTANSQEHGANFKFKAFISYSHSDHRTAVWLHKAIETYRIPKALRGTAGRDGPIPKQLFPVFLDRDELSSSPDLSQSIHEALQASAYLIVLCSSLAARSKWVNQEIIEFVKLGRAHRIHALIAEGDPTAALEKGGCYPPALRFKLGTDGEPILDPTREVLAADLREEGDGKNDAKLKLIAGLLGIPFNALRRREVAAARRRLLVTQAIAGTMAALLVAAGLGAWLSWHYSLLSDERQIPGVRVEYHETTLDLSGWRRTTAAQIARLEKISSALSNDRYTIVKTQPQAVNYVHTVGTSSLIAPDIMCTNCVVKPRTPDAASRTPNEFKVEFDISKLPLETAATIDYTTRYWNAFQDPDQWWTGLRVSGQTDMARFSIIFPALMHPPSETIRFYYHDVTDHFLVDLKDMKMEKDMCGRVSNLTWMIASPSTDRSYRVSWDWSDLNAVPAAKP